METMFFEFMLEALPDGSIKLEETIRECLVHQMATAIIEAFKTEGRQADVNYSDKQ